MSLFLWVLVSVGALNTVAALWCWARGDLDKDTPFDRAVDAVYTFCVGAFALWFLAQGV